MPPSQEPLEPAEVALGFAVLAEQRPEPPQPGVAQSSEAAVVLARPSPCRRRSRSPHPAPRRARAQTLRELPLSFSLPQARVPVWAALDAAEVVPVWAAAVAAPASALLRQVEEQRQPAAEAV